MNKTKAVIFLTKNNCEKLDTLLFSNPLRVDKNLLSGLFYYLHFFNPNFFQNFYFPCGDFHIFGTQLNNKNLINISSGFLF